MSKRKIMVWVYAVIAMPITFGFSLISVVANYDGEELDKADIEEAWRLYHIREKNRREIGEWFVSSDRSKTQANINKLIAKRIGK